MKKLTKSLLIFMCAILVASIPIQSQAMSKANKRAHAAFKKQLKKDKRKYCDSSQANLKYSYLDIDGDKVDELIIYPGFGYCSQVIYDYQKGKVKNVCTVSQGVFTKYYPKKKVILVKNSGHMGTLCDFYYKWKNGKYKLAAMVLRDYGNRDYDSKPVSTTYYTNNVVTTKGKYKAYVKKLVKKDNGKKFSKIKWKSY